MLFVGLVDKVGGTLFGRSAPVADLFSLKVLVGKIIVVGVNSNYGTFEDRGVVFFESVLMPERSTFTMEG